MPGAAGSGDRDQWRTIAREYYSLQAVLYPGSVPAGGYRNMITVPAGGGRL